MHSTGEPTKYSSEASRTRSEYFVLSINTRNSSAKIVAHANSLEAAIVAVAKSAREYVLSKSEPLLHRKEGLTDETTKTHYFSSNSASNIHQIDVFRQQTDVIKGWLSTTQQPRPAVLVRRFMYCSYGIGDTQQPDIQPPPPPPAPPVKKRAPKTLPTGGFPVDVIDSLVSSEQFRRHRQTTDSNKLQPWEGLKAFDDAVEDEYP